MYIREVNNMKIKRINDVKRIIIAYVCAFAVLFTAITPVAFAGNEDTYNNPDEALIVFGKEIKTVNIESYNVASSTMLTTAILEDGSEVGRFKANGTFPYFYIDLPASIVSSYDDGSVYDVEIKYFDSNGGYMFVWYDALKWGKQCAYEIYPGKTKTWKTAKFTLDNAAFNRLR